MKRALVLGGGGNVGIAWETAIVAGLLDCGLDAREADLIIGTSAGSVVGTHLAHGRDAREVLDEMQQERQRPLGQDMNRDLDKVRELFVLWASAERMTPEIAAQVGRMAIELETVPEERWIASFAETGFPGWPEKPLLVCAVDCESGERKAWEETDGVPIEVAVASSCSVPGLFPPVTIDGRRYTDGGLWSGTSADLASSIAPDVVLMIATMGATETGINKLARRDIAREKKELEANGARVLLVQFDDATKEAAGPNLMDPSRRAEVAEAGRAQGRRIADELRVVWDGR